MTVRISVTYEDGAATHHFTKTHLKTLLNAKDLLAIVGKDDTDAKSAAESIERVLRCAAGGNGDSVGGGDPGSGEEPSSAVEGEERVAGGKTSLLE